MRWFAFLPILAAASVSLVVPGCSKGPNLGVVRGVVSQDGIPIPFVLVQFQPVEPRGTYASAYTDADGQYELRFSQSKKGALVGRHEVTLRTSKRDEIQVEDKSTGLMVTPKLPENYKGNLELKFEEVVSRGVNHIDFDLDPKLNLDAQNGKKLASASK